MYILYENISYIYTYPALFLCFAITEQNNHEKKLWHTTTTTNTCLHEEI